MHSQLRLPMIAIVMFLSSGMVAGRASGQSVEHIQECTRSLDQQTQAISQDDAALMVSSTRWFLTSCRDLLRGPDDESSMLSELGEGLIKQGSPEDAIPIFNRCVTIKPDAAYCFVGLGEALIALRRNVDATAAYEKAISIGGYDNVNAAAIKLAHKRLEQLASVDTQAQPEAPVDSSPAPTPSKKFGTGFFVTSEDVLTNNHVIEGCKSLATSNGKQLTVLSTNEDSDLALLKLYDFSKDPDFLKAPREQQRGYLTFIDPDFAKASRADQDKYLTFLTSRKAPPQPIAVFRSGPLPQVGDSVVAFGFPLPGVLSSEGNLSAGILSATEGLENDARFIQISAPVQPGNSGGPLFDSSGHVIGVVEAKLDALKIAELTGDIPQNVNFAVRLSEIRKFLDGAGVRYEREDSEHTISTRNIAEKAESIAVMIDCTE